MNKKDAINRNESADRKDAIAKKATGFNRSLLIPLGVLAIAVVLNLIGWCSPSFCDWYVENVFPVWAETYGRLTGIFSFSVGEWMLYAGAFLVMLLLVWGTVEGILCIVRKKKKGESGLTKGFILYLKFILWVAAIVSLEMTLTCFLQFHVSPLNERYPIGAKTRDEYGLAELTVLRDYVVEQVNALSEEMERDEKGYLVYEGDMKTEAKLQMHRLSKDFPNLNGYYPDPKPFFFSDFFSQQYMMGYYFPFSMEANYNDKMYVINMPASMCHELSHLKGFLLEDEANFIGYLACVGSGDAFFRYSGYMSVLGYLDRDFYSAIGQDEAVYFSHPVICEQVIEDDKFLTEEAWEEVEEDALLDTEMVKEASDKIVETNLTINGVSDGKVSYSRVVDLLLQYYDGILY